MTGFFNADPEVKLLNDGRNVELLSDLTFTDPDESVWRAPAGAHVDGASIPRVLWTLVGPPFVGQYRNASIIHDWFCDKRSRTWQSTHKVFYDGMRASGVGLVRAKVMYYAVHRYGPRWDKRVSHNAALASDEHYNLEGAEAGITYNLVDVPAPGLESSLEDQEKFLKTLEEKLEDSDMTLDELAALAEESAPSL